MREKSFIEILEDKLRADIRREVAQEFAEGRIEFGTNSALAPQVIDLAAARAGRFESWLASNVEPTHFTDNQKLKQNAKRAYGTHSTGPVSAEKKSEAVKPAPANPKAKPKARTLTLEQTLSLELLRRHSGAAITENFDEAELKGAWRKAALKAHPDRQDSTDAQAQKKAAALFTELSAAYEVLQTVCQPVQAAA